MTPPAEITKEGLKPYPSDNARKLNSRMWFFYSVTGITPAMSMRLPNVGSQYLENFRDSQGNWFDGSKTYKVTLSLPYLQFGCPPAFSVFVRVLSRRSGQSPCGNLAMNAQTGKLVTGASRRIEVLSPTIRICLELSALQSA